MDLKHVTDLDRPTHASNASGVSGEFALDLHSTGCVPHMQTQKKSAEADFFRWQSCGQTINPCANRR
jgi:hypothetical protein